MNENFIPLRFPNRREGFTLLAIGLILSAGCQSQPTGSNNTSETEPNDSFNTARVVAANTIGSATLSGEIDAPNDIDVYALGSVAAGDLVSCTLARVDNPLRAALALYDGDGELINEDTLTSITNVTADPSIEHTIREATSPLYLAVSHNTVRASRGQYEIDVNIARGGVAPPPRTQAVLLSFAGGMINDPVFGNYDVGEFDAGDISPIYDGETAAMKAMIVATFIQNYERFALDIWTTDDSGAAAALAGQSYSRVVFGGFNSFAFGAAEDVDLYNQEFSDSAIIFTESFQSSLFTRVPTADELGIAIGNVAAHEMGHLLGLHHVIDPIALMDEASPAFTLLEDQEFISATLSSSIFPLGNQDAGDLLGVILGYNAGFSAKRIDFTPTTITTPLPWANKAIAPVISADSETPVARCSNCLYRAGLAGLGPLAGMFADPADDGAK